MMISLKGQTEIQSCWVNITQSHKYERPHKKCPEFDELKKSLTFVTGLCWKTRVGKQGFENSQVLPLDIHHFCT